MALMENQFSFFMRVAIKTINALEKEKAIIQTAKSAMKATTRRKNTTVKEPFIMKTAVFNIKATSKMVTLPNLYGQYKSKI